MHLNERQKKLAKILRAECQIDCLNNVITRKENDTPQAKRVHSKQPKTANKSKTYNPSPSETR